MYKRFVKAAVNLHVKEGCIMTAKVYLMWKHVAVQMKVAGGLGHKREDWVEHQHQTGSRERDQHRRTKHNMTRAVFMEKMRQEKSNPKVEKRICIVDEKA